MPIRTRYRHDPTNTRLSRIGTAPITLGATSKWPGDPGLGNYSIGWSLGPGNLTVTAAKANAGWPGDLVVSSIHNYSNNSNGIATSMLDEAINAGYIPSQSFKLQNYTTAQINSGAADAAIDTAAAACIARAPSPIWLCYYHEPEDNFTTTAAQIDFRAASRRIALRFTTAGVTNVMWMSIYMCPWTFDNASGRDWRNWHPDWNGTTWHDTITQHVVGLDTYNPLPFSGSWLDGGRTNHTFADMLDMAFAKIELGGYPQWDYVIPEFGMSYGATNPSRPIWTDWATATIAYAKAHRVKSISYWDNSTDTGRYSFTATADPAYPANVPPIALGTKLAGWQSITSASIRKVTI